MILRLFLLFFSLILSTFLFSQKWEWVRTISGTANDTGYSIDIDDSGYVFMTGRCKLATTFENNNSPYGPVTIGGKDIYISKYSSEGNLIWAAIAGTDEIDPYDQGYSVTSDNSGGCYVSGIFNDTSFFGTDTLISEGERDIFITRIDANGNFIWSRSIGGAQHDYCRDVSINNDGDIILCGNIRDFVDFNGNIVGTANQPTGIIVKYDTNGNMIDYVHFDSPKSSFEQITFDSNNNIYTIGTLNGSGTINNTTVNTNNSASWQDICLLKLDQNFNIIWSETAGSSFYDIGTCITLKDSTVYIGGSFTGTALFDTISVTYNSLTTGSTSLSHRDAFIAAYSVNGGIKWINTGGSEGIDEIFGLKISQENHLYISGYYKDSITIDTTTLLSPTGITNGFIARLDTSGNVIWNKNLYNTQDSRCYQIELDKDENIYITGDFYGTINFDTINHTGQNRDAFGGKLLQHTSPSYIFNSSQNYCIGDTAIIEMTSLTSPISYEYLPNDTHTSWIDSNLIYYIIDFEPSMSLTGNIISSNYYYSDTIPVNITITSFNNPTPYLTNDTLLCDTISDFTLYSQDFYDSYLWSNNLSNNNFSNPVIASGNITLTVIDSNNCSGSNQVSIIFLPCLTINEKTTDCNLTYYEPSNTLINNCPLSILELKIINMNGQTIQTIDDMGSHGQLRLPNLSPGVYFINAKYSNLSVQTQKILILN